MQMPADAIVRGPAGVVAAASMLWGVIGSHATAADLPDLRRLSTSVDPCTLISAAEAQSILGVGVTTPQSTDDGASRHCLYSSADKKNYLKLEAINTQKALFERWMKLKEHALPSRQLGSEAYTNGGVLLVWKNGIQLNVSIGDESGDSSVSRLEGARERAAQIALSRL